MSIGRLRRKLDTQLIGQVLAKGIIPHPTTRQKKLAREQAQAKRVEIADEITAMLLAEKQAA